MIGMYGRGRMRALEPRLRANAKRHRNARLLAKKIIAPIGNGPLFLAAALAPFLTAISIPIGNVEKSSRKTGRKQTKPDPKSAEGARMFHQ